MLLFLGTDVKTCLDVVSLFYFIPIVVGKLFIFIHKTSICTDVVMQRLHLFMIEFYLVSLNLFIEVHIFSPHYVMFVLFLIVGPLMHRCYGAGVCYLLILNSGMECNIPSQRCGRLYLPM